MKYIPLRNIRNLRIFSFLSLFLWASLATIHALSKKQKTLLIAVSEGSTQIVNEADPTISELNLRNFFIDFMSKYYTYDQETVRSNIGEATDLMSLELFRTLQPRLEKLITRMRSEPLTQVASISDEGINRDKNDSNVFYTHLDVRVVHRLRTSQAKLLVRLAVRKVGRSKTNKYGIEIYELDEKTK